MSKHTYSNEDQTWKPALTQYRKALASAITAVMEAQAGTHSRIAELTEARAREERRLHHLDEAQRCLAEFDKRLHVVESPEQLQMVVD